jgi:hypothetical protein
MEVEDVWLDYSVQILSLTATHNMTTLQNVSLSVGIEPSVLAKEFLQ